VCRFFDAAGGFTRAFVMLGLMPIAHRRLGTRGQQNDYLLAAMGMAFSMRE
jgi:hypothetical protein